MPESNKSARARQLKANREAGLGDDKGRLMREKAAPNMVLCSICMTELKATKTNTELKQHALGKHGKADYEECFAGAEAQMKELIAKTAKTPAGSGKPGGGASKAEKKKKAAAGMDDMLSAGLSGGPAKKGGKKR